VACRLLHGLRAGREIHKSNLSDEDGSIKRCGAAPSRVVLEPSFQRVDMNPAGSTLPVIGFRLVAPENRIKNRNKKGDLMRCILALSLGLACIPSRKASGFGNYLSRMLALSILFWADLGLLLGITLRLSILRHSSTYIAITCLAVLLIETV
jgi:hypothetical protein